MINLTLERAGEHHVVRSVGPSGIRVGQATYTNPLILSREAIDENWPPRSFDDLRMEHLERIFALEPEVALLGTGSRHAMLPRDLLIEVYRRGVPLEVMTTDAACRTFNVLASDGRHVVAGLLPMTAA